MVATLDDLAYYVFSVDFAFPGTLQDVQLNYFKAYLEANTIPYPSNAGLTDLIILLCDAIAILPGGTFSERYRELTLTFTVTPVDSTVWNDVVKNYYSEAS